MTLPLDIRGVDSDRIDGGGRGIWRLVAVALVVGAVIGALLGFAYGAAQPTEYTATTALSVLPDSSVDAAQNATDPDQDATSFIQSQLVVLNGDQLASTVRSGLKLDDRPDVSSSQVGQTYVVQVSATASDRSLASAIATATAQAYTTTRTQSLGRDLRTRADAVAAQLQTVQTALAAAAAASPQTTTPAESALQTQYQQLLQSQGQIQLATAQVARVVTVLSPASVASPSSLSSTARSALLGALLGAVVALVGFALVRRLAPRVRSVGDLTALGVPVLLPVLPTRRRSAQRGPTPWRSNAGRLLAARLAGRGASRHAPVIVVGATPGVGTSHVAASLAAGIAERGPVLLVLASELIHGSDMRTLRGLSATDVSADVTPDGSVDAIKRAVQCEIPGVWVLPCGGEVAASAGPLPSARTALLTDVLRRATAAGWQVVVDAPALSDSDMAIDCATGGTGVAVLVVARGVSLPADVLSASELFDAQGSRFVGAILNDVPGWMARRRSRRSDDDPQSLQVSFEAPQLPPERPRGRRRPVPVGRAAHTPAPGRATATTAPVGPDAWPSAPESVSPESVSPESVSPRSASTAPAGLPGPSSR